MKQSTSRVCLSVCPSVRLLHRLEETSRDLEATKDKLAEEEFVSGELRTAQENLHSAATQVPPLTSYRGEGRATSYFFLVLDLQLISNALIGGRPRGTL